MFVLVGAEARGKREDIWLALATAKVSFHSRNHTRILIPPQALASSVGPSRPLIPPIHVLVFPSQAPRDLRLAVRGFGFDLPVRAFP